MKKIIISLFSLLAVFACNKNETDFQKQVQEKDNTPIAFNLKVDQMNSDATKVVASLKNGWADGDVVYVFFDAIPTKYVKKTFNGTTWAEDYPGGEFVAGDFSAEGPAASRYMTAVWFPQGAVTVTYDDNKFSFTLNGEKIYSHYMSVHAGYTVSGTTITGTISMAKPSGFVQFFVPGIAAADAPTYRLMEEHLVPKACDYVALAGGVTESALTAGYSLKGMAFTSDNSTVGSLFGGYLASAGSATDYTFSLVKEISVEKPAAVGTYTLSGTKTINAGTSLTFPETSSTWTYSQFVDMGFGGIKWATGNLKEDGTHIAGPLEVGSSYQWGQGSKAYDGSAAVIGNIDEATYRSTTYDRAYALSGGSWYTPTRNQLLAPAYGNAIFTWKTGWTTSSGDGYLITSKVNGLSLFLPEVIAYWSSTESTEEKAFILNLNYDFFAVSTTDRAFGRSIRPVMGALSGGANGGKFTINAGGDKVYFSHGNLQASYNGEWWYWHFASTQDAYIGGEVANNAVSGNGTASIGTVDLFGWSTSATYYGIHNSTAAIGDYYGDFVDWGGLIGSGWRTLTKDEWNYVLNERSAVTRFAKAFLFGTTHGIILFPDNYSHPDGVAAVTGVNATDNTSWNDNKFSATDWAAMEAAGAVFLPAAGMRTGASVDTPGGYVTYWTSTSFNTTDSYRIGFVESSDVSGTLPRYQGCAVRLVYPAN